MEDDSRLYATNYRKNSISCIFYYIINIFFLASTIKHRCNFDGEKQLPSEFFQKIIDLENFLIKEKDIIVIENLSRLYKVKQIANTSWEFNSTRIAITKKY